MVNDSFIDGGADGLDAVNFSSSFNSTAFDDGTYYIVFNVTDGAGNENASADTNRTIIIDNTNPIWDLSAISPVQGANISGTLMISAFNVIDMTLDNQSVYFQLLNSTGSNVTAWALMSNDSFFDGGAEGTDLANFSGSVLTTGLTDGLHYIVFNVTDNASNVNTTAASNVTLTIDNSKSVVSLTTATPLNELNFSSTSGNLSIAAVTISDLTLNTTGVYLQIANSSGDNVTEWTLMVNTSYIDGGPDGLDSANFSGTLNVSVLADGRHFIVFNVTDSASNENATGIANITINLDDTVPTWDLTSMAPLTSANVSAVLTVVNLSISDLTLSNTSVYFQLVNSTGINVTEWTPMANTTYTDGGDNGLDTANFTGTFSTTSLSRDGLHYIVFNVTDAATNANTSATSNRTITIDNTNTTWTLPAAPVQTANLSGTVTVTDLGVSDLTLDNNSVYFTILNASGSNVTSRIQLVNTTSSEGGADGLDFANFSGNVSVTGVTDGAHIVVFNVTDGAGNINASVSSNVSITIDNTNPSVNAILTNDSDNNVSGLIIINATVSDVTSGLNNISSIQYRVHNKTGNETSYVTMNHSDGTANLANYTVTINTSVFADGVYNISINISDFAGNENSSEIRTMAIDNIAPASLAITFNISNSTWASGLNFNVTGTYVEPSASPSTTIVVTQVATNTTWTCDNATGVGDEQVNCTISEIGNTNFGGEFRATLTVVSTTGLTSTTNASIWVFNADPFVPIQPTGVNVTSTAFAQKRSKYQIVVPNIIPSSIANTSQGLLQVGQIMPIYFADSSGNAVFPFASPDVIENLAYTFNFSVNHSGVSTGSLLNLTIQVPGLMPAVLQTQTIYTPIGSNTVTRIAPSFTNVSNPLEGVSTFTVRYNGSSYNTSTNTSLVTYGSYDVTSGNLTVTINVTDNTSIINGSVIFVVTPPVNITSQSVSGINMAAGPNPGASGTLTTYLMNISSTSTYFAPDNLTMMFGFPANVTVWQAAIAASSNTTYNITSNPVLTAWNGSEYAVLANSSFQDSNITNVTNCFNMTFSISNSAIGTKNLTVCMTGYEWKIGQSSLLDFTAGAARAVNFTANISFPQLAESAATTNDADTTRTYKTTLVMGSDGALTIPDSSLPGWSSKNAIAAVIVNGQTLSSTQYADGSVVINGTGLNAGPVEVFVQWTRTSNETVSSSGGAAATPTPKTVGGATVEVSVTAGMQPAKAGATTTVDIPASISEKLGVEKIEIKAKNDIPAGATIEVQKISDKPATIAIAPPAAAVGGGPVYAYLEITTSGFTTDDVEEATIDFKVAKSWLEENGFTPADIALNRFHGDVWSELPTEVIEGNGEFVWFSAVSPGFSTFAVLPKISAVGVTEEEAAAAQPTPTPAPTPAPAPVVEEPVMEEEIPAPGFAPEAEEVAPAQVDYTLIGIIAAIIILGALLYFFSAPRGEKPHGVSAKVKHAVGKITGKRKGFEQL
ncbi:MAG: PGF-pre-PGF domain-containing protein [DPANN group archaeon]|nr:PGF-pre-PGF domain-containing protein [DPANN group archaeon]